MSAKGVWLENTGVERGKRNAPGRETTGSSGCEYWGGD